MQYRQADAVLLVEHKGFTDIFNVDHFGLAIRFAGWRLRLTRPTGAVFVLPGGGFALPGLRVRCSFCRVAASPYPAYKVRCS
ncbi:hypothetical protein NIHE100087_41040 [Enterobacter hormaechei]|nr:hypothetical protein NIHE100087_41040 [Enterobacter hormaechei]